MRKGEKMANEFWNVLITAIASFIVGMAIHSALGHTWGDRLREIFHKTDKSPCYCVYSTESITNCNECKYYKEREKQCRISTE